MTIPVWVLLGFAAWTLLTLFTTVGVYRWARILTGRAAISERRADEVQGSEWYRRAMRAHLNCVENLPVYIGDCRLLVGRAPQHACSGRACCHHSGHENLPDLDSPHARTDKCDCRYSFCILLRAGGVHARDEHYSCRRGKLLREANGWQPECDECYVGFPGGGGISVEE
jgi:hypothetical protein